jgi:hypothetical protein
MAFLHDLEQHIEKKARTFFTTQSSDSVWVRILCCVVFVDIIGIALSLVFFFQVKNMNKTITPSVDVPKTEDVDMSDVHTTLEAFSRRAVEFEYRKINGVAIPEPR